MAERNTNAKVLRIGLFQNGRIIEERLLRTPGPVRLGSDYNKKNMFVVPASDLPRTMTVFDFKGGSYNLQVAPGMTGRIKDGDAIKTIGQGGGPIALGPRSQGRVVMGEATLLFQFVTPPPPRPKPVLPASMRGGWIQGLDRILVTSTALAAILLIGFVVFLESRDWPVQLKRDQVIPDRFVRIVQPDAPEPVVEPEPVEVEDGEGEPTEVAETGDESEPESEPEPSGNEIEEPVEEPSSSSTADELARAEAERKRRLADTVNENTILGQIGAIDPNSEGGGIVDVLSQGAGKTTMAEAFEGSRGITSGVAGAEKSLSGGTSGTGVGIKAGELRKGSGASRAEGAGGTGGAKKQKEVKGRVNISKGVDNQIGGQADGNDISKKLRQRSGQFQSCYERQLKKDPSAGGKVIVMFTIGTSGRVSSASARTDNVGGGVGSCVADKIKRIKFTPPKGGAATVSKTFVFAPSN